MNYFTQDHHNALIASKVGSATGDHDLERAAQRMMTLQRRLYARMKSIDMKLHPNYEVPGGVCQQSAAATQINDTLTISFGRSESDAQTVEHNMGCHQIRVDNKLKAARHPVIELRLNQDQFVIEFILSPDAWYDQRNFAGKFTLHEQRATFFQFLKALTADYYLGFWSGIYVDDMHLNTAKLPPRHILFEFVETFAAGRDYLRIGCWYDADDPALSEDNIEQELFQRIRELYDIYDFVLWRGSNNYHGFYNKMLEAHR